MRISIVVGIATVGFSFSSDLDQLLTLILLGVVFVAEIWRGSGDVSASKFAFAAEGVKRDKIRHKVVGSVRSRLVSFRCNVERLVSTVLERSYTNGIAVNVST